jgi:hypothetical protein
MVAGPAAKSARAIIMTLIIQMVLFSNITLSKRKG